MGYSKEVLQRARTRLEQAKAERDSENQRNLAIAYAREPRLKEIDLELRRTMILTAQAVFSQAGDVKAAMEQVKEKNLALQQERAELISACFEEGFLDDTPICAHCGGAGYVGSRMCECLAELCRQEQKKELTVLSGSREAFSQFRLDYYSANFDARYGSSPREIMEKNLNACRTYAATFCESSGNLLFVGSTGVGKTFLAVSIARTVAERGYSVCYETASQLFSKLEKARFTSDEEARKEAEKYAGVDLLIIDDLGTEMPGQFVTSALYSLLNDRLLASKPMVITTNLNVEEAKRRYSPQIASRLYGSFQRYTFVGEDIRVLKNKVML
jgi:DNA replication protein DnaC